MLSRQQCNALRGIAILGIVLHNYTHWLGPMVKENEYTYTQHNVDRLMVELASPSLDIICHLLSFFGHYGVPLFLMLSAYGLVMKYEKGATSPTPSQGGEHDISNASSTLLMGAVKWVWHHYIKLFQMMIVGYTAFVLVDYMTPSPRHYEFWNVVGQLGMFSNLYSDPDHVIWPGPYWYFGLMVQIYLVYRFILYKGEGSLCGMLSGPAAYYFTCALMLISMCAQFFFDPMGDTLEWYRYNVFGSIAPFVVGLLYARKRMNHDYRRRSYALSALLAAIIVLSGSLTFYSWCYVPIFVCLCGINLVKALPIRLLQMFEWVGGISAAMFVCHPITRKIIIPISRHGDTYAGLLLYLVATIVLAILFQRLIAIVTKSVSK